MMHFSGIRQQIILVALIPILVITMLLGGYSIYSRFADAEAALLEHAQSVTHQLASTSDYAVFSGNTDLLKQAIASTLTLADVNSVYVVDAQDKPLIGESKITQSTPALLHKLGLGNTIYQNENEMIIYDPIWPTQIKINELDEFSNRADTKPLGAVIIQFSKRQLNQHKANMLMINLSVMFFVLIISLLSALWLARRLSNPILRIGKIVHKMGEGELDIQIPQQEAAYELNQLAQTINKMAQQLSEERRMLENKIQHATQDLHEKSQRLSEKNVEIEQAHQKSIDLNEKLSFALTELETIIEANPDLLYVLNRQGQLIKWNSKLESFFGLPPNQLLHKYAGDFFTMDEGVKIEAWLHNVFVTGSASIDSQCKRHDGKLVNFHCTGVSLKNPAGEIIGFTGTGRDITERIEAAQRLEQMAHYDALTGLPNRTLFTDRFRQAFANAKRENKLMALMYVDLDRFKHVNDTLGHKAGDLLLKEATQRMLGCIRQSDTIGRIGGDEFLVLLPIIEKAEDAVNVAEKMRTVLCQAVQVIDNTVYISSSIGIAIYPEHGTSVDELISHADKAMYCAKDAGRNLVRLYGE